MILVFNSNINNNNNLWLLCVYLSIYVCLFNVAITVNKYSLLPLYNKFKCILKEMFRHIFYY